MTYSKVIVDSSIRLYILLNKNIKGKEKENIICKTFNISISTFYNWYRKYNNKEFFLDQSRIKKNKNNKITIEIINFVIEYYKKNPLTKAKNIRKIIMNTFLKSISKSSIYNILKKNNITYKKTQKKIVPFSQKKLKYKKTILKKQINKAGINNIISLDEISVCFGDIQPKGWSEKGKKCFVYTNNKSIKGKRYSLCMATTNKKIINYKIVEKGFKTETYNNFLKETYQKEPTKTFLKDNASIHKSKLVKQTIRKNKIKVIYGIPYHSEYNPIEFIFSILRKKLQESPITKLNELINIIDYFSKLNNEKKFTNIFKHAFELLN